MALPVPYCMGPEVQTSGFARSGGAGGVQLPPSISGPSELHADRAECAERSRPSDCDGTTESIDIEFDGGVERSDSDKSVQQFPYLKKKPYWGNHFWARGYCVDTIGLDADLIRKYVKYQEDRERREEQQRLKY